MYIITLEPFFRSDLMSKNTLLLVPNPYGFGLLEEVMFTYIYMVKKYGPDMCLCVCIQSLKMQYIYERETCVWVCC